MEILIFLIISYVLLSFSLMPLFERAGVDKMKALIPGVNFAEWARLIGRRKRYALWLLFPIVNIFIFTGMAVDLSRSFGKLKFWHTALSVIYAPAMFFLIGRDENAAYNGPILKMEAEYYKRIEEAEKTGKKLQLKKLHEQNPYRKSQGREWVEAVVFAVFAAAFIRMFLIEAYNIPTSSMEGSLNVGDFLFVSKAHYGVRTPKTVATIPLLHNRIPILNTESYWEKPDIGYTRLPALEKIDRGDIIVFNYPEGDSVYVFPDRTFSQYDYDRGYLPDRYANAIRSGKSELVTRPIDKRDHYVKRAVAIPGDELEIRDGQLYLNGEAAQNPKNIQFRYIVRYPSNPISQATYQEWDISPEDLANRAAQPDGSTVDLVVLNQEQIEKIKATNPQATIDREQLYRVGFRSQEALQGVSRYGISNVNIRRMEPNSLSTVMLLTETQRQALEADSMVVVSRGNTGTPNYYFPHDPQNYKWDQDNFGPLLIPAAGASVELTPENISIYRDIITRYEGNTLERQGDSFLINGQAATSYTFQQDYYWAMGDNRHASEDSRVWGFVPADHIVGKPLFVWFSTKFGNMANGINWHRMFRPVSWLAE